MKNTKKTSVPKKVNSKQKGSRGELELAHCLSDAGFPARRGQQYAGNPDAPDIICESLPDWHIECKRTERGNLYNWLAQALKDKGIDQKPVIMHRKSQQDWVAIVRLKDFLELLK